MFSSEVTNFARSHGAIFLKCTAEPVDRALQRLRSETWKSLYALNTHREGVECGAFTTLGCCGFGGAKTYFLCAIPSSHTLCVLSKLLPFSRLCFFFLLVSSQLAPPFPPSFWAITPPHPHTLEGTQPVLTLGIILFVHWSYCFEKNSEVVYMAVLGN